MKFTYDQMGVLKHALGLDNSKRRYRNSFKAPIGHVVRGVCESLVVLGAMTLGADGEVFEVSDAGLLALDQTIQRAHLSACRQYRYTLERQWSHAGANRVVWLMLNPSTAAEDVDDPTIRRCMAFSRADGFAAMTVVNLFAFRATDPAVLIKRLATKQRCNDDACDTLLHDATKGATVVAAWGSHGAHKVVAQRVREVVGFCRPEKWVCLGSTGGSQPRHPLMVPNGTPFMPWFPQEVRAAS